jgi:L-amino acid N-acyltransferase YncA
VAREMEVRPVRAEDAAELATLLNAIIARGGTTALEAPLTEDALARTMLTGPDVICCFVAVEPAAGRLAGFQSLVRSARLADDIGDIGDIATFARVGLTQRGVGAALFAATRAEAEKTGLAAINATIRADNLGGLAFYDRMGFVDHGVQRAAPLKDGTPVDRISKRYALTCRAGFRA